MAKKTNEKKLPIPKLQTVNVTCSTCGTKHEIKSTKEKLSIDVCSHCHPFYTGANTYTRVAGRVEKFNRKYQKQTSDK